MQVFLNLDILDELVSQRQSRIREAVHGPRHDGSGSEASGEFSLRVWIGDHLIAWGQSIRGGMPSRSTVVAERTRNTARRSLPEPVRTG